MTTRGASQRWENGVLVERAIETNRWRVLPDGTEVAEKEEVEAAATQPYKTPVPTKQKAEEAAKAKAIEASETEDKSVKRAAKK